MLLRILWMKCWVRLYDFLLVSTPQRLDTVGISVYPYADVLCTVDVALGSQVTSWESWNHMVSWVVGWMIWIKDYFFESEFFADSSLLFSLGTKEHSTELLKKYFFFFTFLPWKFHKFFYVSDFFIFLHSDSVQYEVTTNEQQTKCVFQSLCSSYEISSGPRWALSENNNQEDKIFKQFRRWLLLFSFSFEDASRTLWSKIQEWLMTHFFRIFKGGHSISLIKIRQLYKCGCIQHVEIRYNNRYQRNTWKNVLKMIYFETEVKYM